MNDFAQFQEKLIEHRIKELQSIKEAYKKICSERKEVSENNDVAIKRFVKSDTFKALETM